MSYDPEHHHRRSIRMPGWDYATPGKYFVTVCAYRQRCLFGSVVDSEMRCNTLGRLIDNVWRRTLDQAQYADLDILQMMPNHLHAIILILPRDADDPDGPFNSWATQPSPPQQEPRRPIGSRPSELGTIVGNLKSLCTRRYNKMHHTRGIHIWQRNYWEHIIRNQRDYERVYTYILSNPGCWSDDSLYRATDGHSATA